MIPQACCNQRSPSFVAHDGSETHYQLHPIYQGKGNASLKDTHTKKKTQISQSVCSLRCHKNMRVKATSCAGVSYKYVHGGGVRGAFQTHFQLRCGKLLDFKIPSELQRRRPCLSMRKCTSHINTLTITGTHTCAGQNTALTPL